MSRIKERQLTEIDYSKYDFNYDTKKYDVKFDKGLNESVVRKISGIKKEPKWMLDIRLKALKAFNEMPMPKWGADLSEIDFNNIIYYMRASEANKNKWEDVPQDVKDTFDRLGIPEAEKKSLAGVGAQYDSEVMYHNIREDLEKHGVVFLSMDEGLKQYPELVKEHFGKIIPYNDNKFAALNTAVWSGGSFVYIPKNVKVEIPLQAYFRINAESFGQFERTLIIGDTGSRVHYIEGCTAPRFTSQSLHSAVVEVIAKENSHLRYTTIQNWANNIYNLVTKRAFAYRNSTVEWVDGNLGSKVTMKYPAIYLMEEGAKGEVLSIALAGKGQHQDAGAKIVHLASNTTSKITSKSVSKDSGRGSYRGLLKVVKGCKNVKSSVVCDALILDKNSRSDTYPYIEIDEPTATIAHEAKVGKINDDEIFYLMSRGLNEAEALTLIILGFIQPFTKTLPLEYSVELNRLIEMEMENSVG
ncbi:MAG: Fe-S cluster assembly protein SufB [Candidatus Diapherotrites archaeon]|uniref:Fe-S cluster assembly protein SufB n=1 Tax=Candidatus Iainarchaeum sp. TaxID=3101447 RepID=A0A2D6LQ56_9ARCH|nr:Fe-S cluster assembly protein SufB [Candidatus Diapherotrites archaeon]|tara:strand:- start:3881 stop:5293 length:1413 start_codon:yes stop_codon:yes gene_type:complete